MKGMRAIVDTIDSIDENSKKIVFKHFQLSQVNHLQREIQQILVNIQKIAEETSKPANVNEINSDDLESDSSGNRSDNDEVNQIHLSLIHI